MYYVLRNMLYSGVVWHDLIIFTQQGKIMALHNWSPEAPHGYHVR